MYFLFYYIYHAVHVISYCSEQLFAKSEARLFEINNVWKGIKTAFSHTKETLRRKLSVKYKESLEPVIWAASCWDLAQFWPGWGPERFSTFLVISHYTKHGALRGKRKGLLHGWLSVTFPQFFFAK